MYYLAFKDCDDGHTYCILVFKTISDLENAKEEIDEINNQKWDDKDFDGDDFEYIMDKIKTPFETIFIDDSIYI